jgi:hypothetical protein
MRFSRTPRDRVDVGVAATRQLTVARDRYRRLADRHDEVTGTAAERRAWNEMEAARVDIAARQRWLRWVDRGF